ncbi:hypothetical protein CTAYLR_002390 [Chrysophaeum taylorii]|uniref:Uncharacterized protein n=1 Tax=Chrysophaeum taylorii TaxID=2483200 RepID=A0AAD7UIL1_9STRA|nr:hypothetical protein CTAYLR_002390 [Chrysophaeum taylorii]
MKSEEVTLTTLPSEDEKHEEAGGPVVSSRREMIEQLRLGLYETQRQRSQVDLAEGARNENTAVAVGGTEDPGETSPTRDLKPAATENKALPKRLGTLWGVFLPCLQNILGVILFLRLTSITAQAGTWGATGIILVCAASTFLTALSLSAVATNGRVAAGGPYFVISRNLGPEVGTAVGLLFYLGTTIAASMYVLGATETLYDGFKNMFEPLQWEMRAVTTALALMAVLAYIVLVGVKQVNAAASVFLAIVLFSVASSLVGVCVFAARGRGGALSRDDRRFFGTSLPKWERDKDLGTTPDFQILIALFYPSVTGIMAGSNRSGVLASPSRSIPVGTLSAIAVTTILYVVFAWAFGLTVHRQTLYDKKLAVALVAWPSVTVVKLGIFLSSIGAALQSLTGAPRLLFAIAQDGTMPALTRLLASHAETPNGVPPPRRASLLTPRFTRTKPQPDAGTEEEDDANKLGGVLSKVRASTSSSSSSSSRRKRNATNALRLTAAVPAKDDAGDEPARAANETDVENPCKDEPRLAAEVVRKKKRESDVTPLAVGITWLIASFPCLAGKLDAITPIVTMFFLLMYATVNLSCFLLAYLRSPGFRPTWHYFHWSSAGLGFLWCVALMFTINVVYAFVAILIGLCAALYVRKEGVTKNWGDATAGIRFQLARDQLLALTERSTFYHAKNWRPQLLVMCKVDNRFNPERPELLGLAGCLKKGQGLLMAHALIDAGAHGSASRAVVSDAATEILRLHLQDHNIQGFPRAVVYRDRAARRLFFDDDAAAAAAAEGELRRLANSPQSILRSTGDLGAGFTESSVRAMKDRVVKDRRALLDAMLSSAQSAGIGAMRPNTVLLGWPTPKRSHHLGGAASCGSPSSDRAHRADFVQLLSDITSMRKALIVLKGGAMLATGHHYDEARTIDVWWVVQDGGLLLLLPWLMQRHKTFGKCRVRVFAVMTGLFAHCWNADHGGAEAVQRGDLDEEAKYLDRFKTFVLTMLDDVRIDAEVHAVAGLDFVWAAAHVYRDTIGLRGRTTYQQQLTTPVDDRPFSPIAKLVRHVVSPKYSGGATSPLARPDALPDNVHDAPPPAASSPPPPPDLPFSSPVLLVGTDDDKFAPLRGLALALNGKMRRHSAQAALVVTNLPYMTHLPPTFFVDYVDALTNGLDSVVLVRGSGAELVTKYG